MAISLQKGQKISLAKVASDAGIQGALTKVFAGLGWDTNKYDGGAAFDLDASVFMCDSTGKVTKDSNFVFYGNLKSTGIEHMGDNLTGVGDGDDEVVKMDLSAVPSDVEKIAFAVTIYDAEKRVQNFGMVDNAFIRIVDELTGIEILRYDLGEDYSIETALVVAELYRSNGEWKFNAIGAGFSGGLGSLCANYGLNIG